MRLNGLRAKATKKYKAMTNSNHKLPVAPNRLEQSFAAKKPQERFVSEITYISTQEGCYI
jgi:putative transposase